VQLYPVFPAEDEHDRRAKRPIGRDSNLYCKIVHEWSEIIRAADEMGIVGYEGYEIAREAGAEGEIDGDDVLRRISVVPKPLQ